jgi:hypothetical protein
LRALLTPEGFALATTDAPYAAPASEEEDAYLWRSRWVAALARHAAAIPGPWPSHEQEHDDQLHRSAPPLAGASMSIW